MSKPNTDEGGSNQSYQLPIKNRLTPQEIHALDAELKKYIYKKWVSVPIREEIELTNAEQWYIDRGAKNKHGDIIIKDYKSPLYSSDGKTIRHVDCEPILYEQLTEDLEQWKRWRSKVAYAKGKELEELNVQFVESNVIENQELDY